MVNDEFSIYAYSYGMTFLRRKVINPRHTTNLRVTTSCACSEKKLSYVCFRVPAVRLVVKKERYPGLNVAITSLNVHRF